MKNIKKLKNFINKTRDLFSKASVLRNNEKGSTLIIITLIFTSLMIITALIVDLGIAYYKTAELENAVDASALAAGQLLPIKEDNQTAILAIKNKAIEYATKNSITNITQSNVVLSNKVNGYYTQLKITVPTQLETSFAKIVGVNFINISRNATVKLSPVKQVGDVVPMSITKTNLDASIANNSTTHLALKVGGGDGTTGAFGAIDLDGVKGGGANDYNLWLTYGYTTALSAGEQIYPVETGNMAGPTNSALIQRYNSCTHFPSEGGCTLNHYSANCSRIVKVPVVEYINKHSIKIRGFAAFVLEPFTNSGYVYGSFIKMVISGPVSDNLEFGDALDYGLYSAKLTN